MISNTNSVLAVLSTKNWTPYKHDKTASDLVTSENNMAENSGRFNKKLFPKYSLRDIKTVIQDFKIFFGNYTLPYDGIVGTRILPVDTFFEFNEKLDEAKNDLEKQVLLFIKEYDQYIKGAEEMLGDRFNPLDYPSKDNIKERFSIGIDYIPVPNSREFNDKISNYQVTRLNEQNVIMATQAIIHLKFRVKTVLEKILDTTKRDSKRIYETTISTNVKSVIDQLTKLNHLNNVDIASLIKTLNNDFMNIDINYLKSSKIYREKLAVKLEAAIKLCEE